MGEKGLSHFLILFIDYNSNWYGYYLDSMQGLTAVTFLLLCRYPMHTPNPSSAGRVRGGEKVV